MEVKDILKTVDHTLLATTATWPEIQTILDDAMAYETASACIPASYVKKAAEYVSGKLAICTVIGFPNGYSTTAAKVFECKDAIQNGADEIDMVINLTDVKNGDFDTVEEEIRQIKAKCQDHILKVIVETCQLTKEELIELCGVVTRSGADFIKTSTGFSTAGATFEDVEVMAKYVGEGVKIKAAGGISSLEDAETFIALGASRLGTSRIIKIVKNEAIKTDSY
ncbi:TPA: deoxyribose-phosphate aldolase [Streptococcus pyogenes]